MSVSSSRQDAYGAWSYVSAQSPQPVSLPRCGGWLLRRDLGPALQPDWTNAYPLFSCTQPELLPQDLAAGCAEKAVTLTLVLDPMVDWPLERLIAPGDVLNALSEHWVIDLQRPGYQPSAHHRRSLRKGQSVEVRQETDLPAFLSRWLSLYEGLAVRHARSLTYRFASEALAALAANRRSVLFSGWHGAELLGADWYLVGDNGVVRAHLSCYSDAGYAAAASYPMLMEAVTWFRQQGAVWMDLGGAPGQGALGLRSFKAGWATEARRRWLFGRVLQPQAYAQACRQAGVTPGASNHFPAYFRPQAV